MSNAMVLDPDFYCGSFYLIWKFNKFIFFGKSTYSMNNINYKL